MQTQQLARRTDPITSHIAAEIWKDIPGFEGKYKASSRGRIKSVGRFINTNGGKWWKPSRILKQSVSTHGYPKITLGLGKRKEQVSMYTHKLVVMAFFGNAPLNKNCVAHYDGNKKNNHVSNLRWATWKENEADSVRLGSKQRGEKHYSSKLCVNDVLAIRASHDGIAKLCRTYGINKSSMYKVLVKKSWAHI